MKGTVGIFWDIYISQILSRCFSASFQGVIGKILIDFCPIACKLWIPVNVNVKLFLNLFELNKDNNDCLNKRLVGNHHENHFVYKPFKNCDLVVYFSKSFDDF